MGKINTTKLDNGMVGFEIIYGGAESPFEGIDASKNSRYIDPRCFQDSSNFLLVEGELCITKLLSYSLPSNGITYPQLAFSSTQPCTLLGIGKLPCEGITKNWALFTAPNTSSGLINYRLMLWALDQSDTEIYNLMIPAEIAYTAQQNAKATITFAWNYGLAAWQNTPAYPILPGPSTPATIDGNFYDYFTAFSTIGGTPSTGTPYSTQINLAPTYALFTGSPTAPTPATSATALAALINASSSYPFSAVVDGGNPNQVDLTAKTQSGYGSVDGVAGNLLTISIPGIVEEFGYYSSPSGSFVIQASPANGGLNPSPFSKPSLAIVVSPFSGGQNAGTIRYSAQQIAELTYETVGDNIFFAGWPAGYMLQFNNTTKQFNMLTNYQGERILKKFANHLIGVGLINSSQQFETESWLWLNWSAPGNFSQWNSIDLNGFVTGAGGEQLADISDVLTGLVISNSTAFILRAEGMSYATALQGSSIPFDVNHVALATDSQGCPSTNLWTQFDQAGFYVGQTNIFMLLQSAQAVGDKVKDAVFPLLIGLTSSAPPFSDGTYGVVNVAPLTMLNNKHVGMYFGINIQGKVFVFNPEDQTWMKLDYTGTFPPPVGLSGYGILKAVSLPANATSGEDGSYQYKATYLYSQSITFSGGIKYINAPVMYEVRPNLSATDGAYIIFPMEEVVFGRDIMVDAIYVLMSGAPGVTVQFAFQGIDPETGLGTNFNFSNVVLPSGSIPGTDQEFKIFSSDGQTKTMRAPGLAIVVPAGTISYTPPKPFPFISYPDLKISKIAVYGSYDPSQRPV